MRDLMSKVLGKYGLDENILLLFKWEQGEIGRVIAQYSNRYMIVTEKGEVPAIISGSFFYNIERKFDLPCVGDWVVYNMDKSSEAVISKVLPRKTALIRRGRGRTIDEQVFASNIDYVFIVLAADNEVKTQAIDRHLVIAYESGAQPILIITKTDLCDNINKVLDSIYESTGEIKVLTSSLLDSNRCVNEIKVLLSPNKTAVFIGASGVGKSTLINRLVGKSVMSTGDVRVFDGKGRHTTTIRQLVPIKEGGSVIDTPGIRSISIWCGSAGLESSFNDIYELAKDCKYSNCPHIKEEGCAVLKAVDDNILSKERYLSYLKIKEEQDLMNAKEERKSQGKVSWKNLQAMRKHNKKVNKRRKK